MNISDEAVEAAARVYQGLLSRGGHPKWDDLDSVISGGKEWRLDYIRAALSAAAPFIAAQAWDEGWYAEGWQQNPYRSQA